jgi:two-component system cell cycle sensor histidine kinase/response regulator CckA
MSLPMRQSRLLADGDELIAALQRHARDRTSGAADEDVARIELSLLHLQKLATVGQLAADVAHDFGNLMTVMLGYSELLLTAAENGDPLEREHLAELRHAAERASALTTRLLGYSRRTADAPGPQNLSVLVNGMAAMLGRLVGSGGRLAIMTEPTAGPVIADGKQIEQLLINLVLNSRDAIAAGGQVDLTVAPVRLTAPLKHALGTAPAGNYVRIRVHDNGCGMDPDTMAQLFRPFFTTKSGGAGLGLTIVSRVAHRTNAAVIVDSVVGQGTTVDLYFPRLSLDAGAGH